MFRRRSPKIHFVGIGGIGMSGIAEVLLNLGYRVTGSDLKDSEVVRRLVALGGVVHIGHAAENVATDVDVVVTSSAVKRDNPEVRAARARSVPVIPRAEMLAELMRLKEGVAVAGSHGKTTTTSMIAHVLAHAGLDPTAVIGGKVNAFGSNAKLGKGEVIVVEADESDGSFLKLTPAIAVVTNIDPEHLDHFGAVERLHDAFVEFMNRVPFYGRVVLCLDHPAVQALLPRVEKPVTTYGFSSQAEYRASDLEIGPFRAEFSAHRGQKPLGRFALQMVGAHNALNALAAIAVADEMGVAMDTVREALADFRGVQRRFTVRGEIGGVTVVDDYGHHPAEIRATLAGARKAFGRRIVVAFQPHRYTRTRDLMAEFATSFNEADVLLVGEVYAAGEDPIPGVTGEALADAVRTRGHRDVTFVPDRKELAPRLAQRAQPGDLVITLGAGDITQVGEELLALLRARGVAA